MSQQTRECRVASLLTIAQKMRVTAFECERHGDIRSRYRNRKLLRLADLRLALQYRSNEQIIARDFYDRCLPAASSFRRAVGFFATTCFSAVPEAYERFFKQGGYMQLVCCPVFSRGDIELLKSAFLDRRTVLKSSALNTISFESKRMAASVK